MRLTLQPLVPSSTPDALPVLDASGQEVCSLWTRRLDWQCREQRLQLQVIAVEPLELPAAEPSEPAVSALARVQQALHGGGALLVLRNPAAAFGAERIAFTEGVRLFAITHSADEVCWDAALSLGQPVYGVRGTIACDCRSVHPGAVISALAYGNFTCEEGLELAHLREDRSGVDYLVEDDAEASVIVRGGFEAARLSGRSGTWRDHGGEAYVRLVIRSARGACWTQPRFVAPQSPSGPTHGR